MRLGRNDIHVVYADAAALVAAAGGVERALAWLQPTEPERFTRYRADADRMMFLGGRLLARGLVGRALGVGPMAWRWREGAHGRPDIADPPTSLRFNISHSAGMVVCALAEGRDVGVDVEHLTRPPVDPRIVRRYCSPDEAVDCEAQGAAWQDRFLRYWTLKEAYLKARGLGVSVPLDEITFDLQGDDARVRFHGSLAGGDTRWALRLYLPTPQHLIAVAASTADGTVPVITLDNNLQDLFAAPRH